MASGKTFKQNTQVQKIFKQTTDQKKVFFGTTLVFSSDHDVTYHIDTSNVVVREIADDTDAITQAPSATKSGWTFVGWRQDTAANPSVLAHLIVTEDNIHLYAVFKQTITVTLVGGNSTLRNSGTRYYNNGTVANPSITLSAATLQGWSLVGYKTTTSPSLPVNYNANTAYAFSQNTTLYTLFQQTVTMQVTCKGTLYSYPKTRYVNNNNYNNPVAYFNDQTLSDAVFKGYSTDGTTTVVIATLANGYTLTQNIHFYAVWTYNSAVLVDDPNGLYYETGNVWAPDDHPPIYYSTITLNGDKYVSLTVTLRAYVGCGGAWIQNPAIEYLGGTFVVFNSTGSVQGDWQDGPCAYDQLATVTCENIPQQNPYVLQAWIAGQRNGNSWVRLYKVIGNGRTIVY